MSLVASLILVQFADKFEQNGMVMSYIKNDAGFGIRDYSEIYINTLL